MDEKIATWERYYQNLTDSFLFPNEYVLRCFLGKYPNLKMDHNYAGRRVCDIGCGDGRNITLLNKLKLEIYATEVTQQICQITKNKLISHPENISADIRTGFNWSIPFEDNFFEYILSWNACYYMKDAESSVGDHVAEFARVMKKDGYLVVSVPSPQCFSLIGAEEIGNNLIQINTKSKWNMLNGSIYHRFRSFEEIEAVFGTHFYNFQKCRISDDCFGLSLDYFVFVCQKR